MGTLLEGLESGINTTISKGKSLLGNPVATAVGGAITGGAIVGAVAIATRKRKKSNRKASRKRGRKVSRRSRKTRRSGRSRRYARTAGKRKDTSTRRIRMTKNGQPYIILRSGKARFIKKSSARTSRRRRGGRY